MFSWILGTGLIILGVFAFIKMINTFIDILEDDKPIPNRRMLWLVIILILITIFSLAVGSEILENAYLLLCK